MTRLYWRDYDTCTTCDAAPGFACHDLRSSPRAPYPTTIARPHRGRVNLRIARSREEFAARRRATNDEFAWRCFA